MSTFQQPPRGLGKPTILPIVKVALPEVRNMKCPACQKEQPMSFKCRACGADLMRRPAGGQSPRSVASSQQPERALQPRGADTDMKMTMPVSALRMPRPGNGEAEAPIMADEENPYSAPAAPASMAMGYDTSVSEYVLAGRGARLGAQLLDSLFMLIAALPGGLMMFGQIVAMTTAEAGGEPPTDLPAAGIVVMLLAVLGFAVYQIIQLVQHGQTLGKKILGIRIVNNDDGQIPSWTRSFLMRGVVNGMIGQIPFVGMFYALADPLFIFREDRRCIHDLIAGTKVVEAR